MIFVVDIVHLVKVSGHSLSTVTFLAKCYECDENGGRPNANRPIVMLDHGAGRNAANAVRPPVSVAFVTAYSYTGRSNRH